MSETRTHSQVVLHELRTMRLLSQRDHASRRCGGYVTTYVSDGGPFTFTSRPFNKLLGRRTYYNKDAGERAAPCAENILLHGACIYDDHTRVGGTRNTPILWRESMEILQAEEGRVKRIKRLRTSYESGTIFGRGEEIPGFGKMLPAHLDNWISQRTDRIEENFQFRPNLEVAMILAT